jgi:transposase-like protein
MQRKSYNPNFKAKVALELVKELQTVNEIATEHKVHPNVITKWKKHLLDKLPEIFSDKSQKKAKDNEELVASLYQKIGQLEVELDWLKKKSGMLR